MEYGILWLSAPNIVFKTKSLMSAFPAGSLWP